MQDAAMVGLARLRKTSVAALVVACLVLAFGVFAADIQRAVTVQLGAFHLLPEAVGVTELYFTHPNELPDTYAPLQKQRLSFTVHNLENSDKTYEYTVSATPSGSGQPVVLATGKITLAHDRSAVSDFTILPPDLGQRIQIVVKLDSPSEAITYWLERKL